MTGAPLLFWWDGEAMRPAAPVYARAANAQFVVGLRYMLAEHEDRGALTHRHQFAWIREAWQSLPQHLAEQLPTPEHLRKRALIECGFYDETLIDAGTNAAALRVASVLRSIDDFAHVVVRGAIVARRTAKSQSRRAMNADEFKRSKSAILEHIAELIGVEPEQLAKARQA